MSRILLSTEVAADDIKKKFGRIGMRRNRVTDTVEITFDIGDRAVVACFSGGEEKEFVEELEGRGRGLVDTGNDDNLSSPC